mgnify:CR=1 FL=1
MKVRILHRTLGPYEHELIEKFNADIEADVPEAKDIWYRMFQPFDAEKDAGLYAEVFAYTDAYTEVPESAVGRAWDITNSSPGELFGAARDFGDVVAEYRAKRLRSLSVGDKIGRAHV